LYDFFYEELQLKPLSPCNVVNFGGIFFQGAPKKKSLNKNYKGQLPLSTKLNQADLKKKGHDGVGIFPVRPCIQVL
jgi:hypothetical protein